MLEEIFVDYFLFSCLKINSMKLISRVIVGVVMLYQILISPFLMNRCRYIPSCSSYMIEAIKIHGLKGVILGIKRILRCHPWGGFGFDPIPDKNPKSD